MTRVFHSIVLFTVLVSTINCAGQTSQGASQEQMIEAAKSLDQRIVAAINKGDVDAVMATYWNSPELVFYAPDALELRGWQAVKNALAESFARTPGAKLELLESNYQVAGDVVIGSGKWRMTIPSQTGVTELLGRYTDVKTQKDGKWVYTLDHSSVPLPPPSSSR
jgi:ketosteroid isomerase-like protein